NPQAMVQSVTAMDAYHKIGWPESKYVIAQAILFAVESPKSNAIPMAIARVMGAFEAIGAAEVPLHLRDTHYQGAEKLGHKGYQYPHDFPGHYVDQNYLPGPLAGKYFYEATQQGMEEKIGQNQERRRNKGRN